MYLHTDPAMQEAVAGQAMADAALVAEICLGTKRCVTRNAYMTVTTRYILDATGNMSEAMCCFLNTGLQDEQGDGSLCGNSCVYTNRLGDDKDNEEGSPLLAYEGACWGGQSR